MEIHRLTLPRFSTPLEYLEYVRVVFAVRESAGAPDPDLERLLHERSEALGVSLPNTSMSSYESVVEGLAADVVAGCESRYGVNLFESCAFGPLESQTVNARCFRSDEGHHALVLHHGLMNILHKRSKLLTAAVRPSSVLYCNRSDASQLTAQMLAGWADELGDIYRMIGETKGAVVMLDPEATHVAGVVLGLSESFVLGHEAGHVIAGHLEDQSRLVPDDEVPSLRFFPENQAHADEFEADRYGFEAMGDSVGGVSKTVLLGAVVSTFSTLSLIGAGQGGDSHPSVAERIHRIVDEHFNSETSKLVHRWLDDGDHDAAAKALSEAA